MASTKFWQFRLSKEKQVVDLWAKVTFSSGTPTLVRGKGIAGVSKTATGEFTFTLANAYNALLDCKVSLIKATGGVAAPCVNVASEAVATLAAPTVVIHTFAIDNSTPTNPGDTETMLVKVTLSNTSVY